MREAPGTATRRLVLLLAGGTGLVSLALIAGAELLSRNGEPRGRAMLLHEAARASATPPVPQPQPPEGSPNRGVVAPAPAPKPPDESSLMAELRAIKEQDPKRALELAREGNLRFPDGREAVERASIAIHALSALGFSSEARGEAEDMVNRYPDGPWVREVEQFTGAHRHRNVRVNAEGKLEFYDLPADSGR